MIRHNRALFAEQDTVRTLVDIVAANSHSSAILEGDILFRSPGLDRKVVAVGVSVDDFGITYHVYRYDPKDSDIGPINKDAYRITLKGAELPSSLGYYHLITKVPARFIHGHHAFSTPTVTCKY